MVDKPEQREDLLNANRVGEMLGVTGMRVRQLVTEGKLAPAMNLGVHANVWHYADVRACQARLAGRPASWPLGLLAGPPRPLRLEHDVVLDMRDYGTMADRWDIHVRVWSGDAPEGRRVVVLLGSLSFGPHPVGQIEDIVPRVRDQLTDLDHLGDPLRGVHVVWLAYVPGVKNDSNPHQVEHLMWTGTSADVAGAGALPRVWNRVGRALGMVANPKIALSHPLRRDASLAEVERITGQPAHAFPYQACTPQVIERWQAADRTTVDVVHDEIYLHTLLSSAARIEAAGTTTSDDVRAVDAQAAVRLLAVEARERLERLRRSPWNDGTVKPENLRPRSAWPTIWAARLVPPEPDDNQQRMIDAHHDQRFPVPSTKNDAGFAPLAALVTRLRHWSQACDQFADHPDPPLSDALDQARSLLSAYLRAADHDYEDYPETKPIVSDVVGKWDRAYLHRIRWDATAGDSQRRRRLAHKLGADFPGWLKDPGSVRYGLDAANLLVAHYPGHPDQPGFEQMALEWPLRPAENIPPGTRIVADGESGHRPAYLVEPSGRMTPLPKPPNQNSQWNFGYSGGGPGALEYAIKRQFIPAGHDYDDAYGPLRHWIQDQVERGGKSWDHDYGDNREAREAELCVDIDELRHRLPR